MEFKFDTYYRCRSEKDVEDLWNWFNENGGVRKDEYTDSLVYMKTLYNSDCNKAFCLYETKDYWDIDNYSNKEDNDIIDKDAELDGDNDGSGWKYIVNYGSLNVKLENKIHKVNVEISELPNGQVFIAKLKKDEDGAIRYKFIKCKNDEKVCILDLDTFEVFYDIEYYDVVELLNCELRKID